MITRIHDICSAVYGFAKVKIVVMFIDRFLSKLRLHLILIVHSYLHIIILDDRISVLDVCALCSFVNRNYSTATLPLDVYAVCNSEIVSSIICRCCGPERRFTCQRLAVLIKGGLFTCVNIVTAELTNE